MIIGIDHGYAAIKSKHFTFSAGIVAYDNEPFTMQNVLEYEGRYYVCGTGRQPLIREKMSTPNYFLLTLAAVAKEIKYRGENSTNSVILAAGLPLTGYGRDKKPFREYLLHSSQSVDGLMNLGSDPADQVVRYSIAGTEVVLKLSALAAKNLALFLVAFLKDQKKTRGKTRLVRMLKDGRPPRFFDIPTDRMKEFAQEAKTYGLLFVAKKDKRFMGRHEIMVFADDAAKIQRIMDRMGLDFVKSELAVGEAEVIRQQAAPTEPTHTETVQTDLGEVSFEVGGFEDEFSIGDSANFTPARENDTEAPQMNENPSEPSSQNKNSLEPTQSEPDLTEKKSVREELKEIKRELNIKEKAKQVQPEKGALVPKLKKPKTKGNR